jgi:hypothetical protein
MKTAEEVLRELGDVSALADVSLHWDEAMAAYPAGGPDFLAVDAIRRHSAATGLDRAVTEELVAAALLVRDSKSLSQLLWHCYWRVFHSPEPCPPRDWPEPACLGERRGLLYLLAAVAYVPLVENMHRNLGIPAETTHATLQQAAHFCKYMYQRGHAGRPGVYQSQLGWLRFYTCAPYFRLGRLEFWLEPMRRPLMVYRHRQTGQLLAFPAAGTRFDADGYCYPREEDYAGKDSWLSELNFVDGKVCGTPISPRGYALREQRTLSLAEWDLVLSKGDDSLSMHIPSGGHMSMEDCRDSLQQARDFFQKHFPERPVRTVNCASWIFNNQLQEILPEPSNLTAFQRELYLFPVASSAWDGLWFIFLKQGPFDLKEAPRGTDLQRRILDFLATGQRWRSGGMLYLLDDLEHFGTQHYLRNEA